LKKIIFFILLILGANFSCDVEDPKKQVQVDTTVVEEPVVEEEVIHQFNDEVIHKLDRFFAYRNKVGRFNGVVLFAKGNYVFEKAYGFANFKKRDSLTVNTSFQLASVSKPVTATAVLMLVDQHKIALSDSVQKFLPEFPYRGITIEQLLSHRSGLGNYIYWTEKYWKDQDSLMSNNEMLSLMVKYKPAVYYSPNRRYYYNNTNYALLALIVAKVSGMTFEEFLKQNIFGPLKMENTFLLTRENVVLHHLATGYKNKRRPYPYFFLDGVHGDKGLFSSVGDLYKFDRALRNGELISDSTKINSYTNRSKYYRKPYGLGWRLNSYNGKQLIYHHGWWRGFKTYFLRLIEEDKTIIILSNTTNGSKLSNKMLFKMFDDALKLSETHIDKDTISKSTSLKN
jgi:CubicO group peptidase (beta-lactamase class C family)